MLNRKIRNLRHVYRFNFHHVNVRQNVAEHSFFVTLYAKMFAEEIFETKDNPDFYILLTVAAAMEHDFEEAIIGDIPYLVRRKIPEVTLRDLYMKASEELGIFPEAKPKFEIVQHIVDFADAYELKIYLEEELRSGNKFLISVENETYNRLCSHPLAHILKSYIDELEPVYKQKIPDEMSHG